MSEPEVTILYGGFSEERKVSLATGHAVRIALAKHFVVCSIDIQEKKLPASLLSEKTVVFPALHGEFGEDGQLQELLEEAKIEFAGSRSASSRLCFDKALAKAKVSDLEIECVPGIVYNAEDDFDTSEIVKELGDQLIVKPVSQGSSVGLSVVGSERELNSALLRTQSGSWLVEKRIIGRELTVGVVDGKAMGVVEIIPKSGVYDYEHKYVPGRTDYRFPAKLDNALTEQLQGMSEKIFTELGCRDFARIDFMLSKEGVPYFLELNTLPGLTATSLLPKSASCVGKDFETLVLGLVTPAVERFKSKSLVGVS